MWTERMTAVDISEVFAEGDVATIDCSALHYVTGGRIDAGPQTLDPKAAQAIQAASTAFQNGLKAITDGKAQQQGQTMQMVQQMMGAGKQHG